METLDFFNDNSDLYASARPIYPDSLFQFLSLSCDAHGVAWDCATGNGQAAVSLSSYFKHVEATDISDNQISNSFERPNIKYSIQPAEKVDFPDIHFDLVNVAQALHWFDFNKFWQEVSRVLKPNGLFAAYTYAWSYVTDEIDSIIRETINKAIEPYWAENNKLCWDGYSTISFPFKPIKTPHIELTNAWTLEQVLNYLQTWSATRRCMVDIGSDFFEEATDRIASVWGNPNETKEVSTPLSIVAGYNRTR